MARFLIVLVAAAVIAVQAGGQMGHAAPATSEVFWRTVLPHSPLPDSILRLLRPAADTSFVSKPEQRPPFDYQDYKRSSSPDDHSSDRAGGEQRPPFDYQDYKRSSSGDDHSSERAGGEQRPPFDYQDYKRSSSGDDHSSERAGAAATAGGFDYDNYRGAETRRVSVTTAADDHSSERAGAAASAGGFDYDNYRGAETRRVSVTAAADTPFGYNYKAPSTNQAGERHTAAADTPFAYGYKEPSTDTGGGKAEPTKTTVFFHEDSVRVGERLPFHFPPASPAALGLLPRRAADSVPFTAPALPGALAAFGVATGSAMASSMEATLRACETPTIPGESKFCATSLEALMERAMGVLGTRDVRPVTSTLPRAGAPLQTYTVRAVRRVEGGPVFVACHDEPYPYTVYRCHTTGPSRAYMVEMEGAHGGGGSGAVSIATVCHTDTSMWNPEHVSFRLLGTKPGGAPVCHLMPYGHIIWAKNVKLSTA